MVEERDLFDKVLPYDGMEEAMEPDMTGQTIQVCTVRQPKLRDVAIGNLYWLVQAHKARRRGAEVVVTDFYDKAGSNNQGTLDLLSVLGMRDDEKVHFRRAEDVPRDLSLWLDVVQHIRQQGLEALEWAQVGKVTEGLTDVLESADDSVPDSMQRLIEELSVWVDGIDDEAVIQLVNHERQSTTWVLTLRERVRKQFWNLQLPFENEYRGRYQDLDGDTPVIIQRRIQDLAGKLAEKPDPADPKQSIFYHQLFTDLVVELRSLYKPKSYNSTVPATAYRNLDHELDDEYDDEDEEEVSYGLLISDTQEHFFVANQLAQLDPRLPVFYFLDHPELVGEYIAMIHSKKAAVQGVVAGVELLIEAESSSPEISLDRLHSIIPFVGMGNKKLQSLLVNERVHPQTLCSFWLNLVGSSVSPSSFTHPAADKIARLHTDHVLWPNIRDAYLAGLPSFEKVIKQTADPFSVPMIAAIVHDLLQTDPGKFFSMIEKWLNKDSYSRKRGVDAMKTIPSVRTFFTQCLERLSATSEAHRQDAQRLIESLGSDYFQDSAPDDYWGRTDFGDFEDQ